MYPSLIRDTCTLSPSPTVCGSGSESSSGVRMCVEPESLIYRRYDIKLTAEIKVERKGIQCQPDETSTSLHSIFDRCHTLLGELTLPHDDKHILPLAKKLANCGICFWPEALRLIQGLLRMRQVMPNSPFSPTSICF